MRSRLLVLLLFAACNDDPPAIEGEWFSCLDLECTALASYGLRFANGTVFELNGLMGELDPGEVYCSGRSVGLYTLEGDQLTVSDDNGSDTITVVFEDETFFVHLGGEDRRYRRVDPARSTGTCDGPENAPRILSFRATPEKIDAGGSIALSWTVEDATAVTITRRGAIDPIIHNSQQQRGALTVGPLDVDTRFQLIASSGDGVATEDLTVAVETGQEVVFEDAAFVGRMAIDAQHLYFTQPELGAIARMELDGANVETIAAGVDPEAIALDGGALYFLESSGLIRRVTKNGGAITDVATVAVTLEPSFGLQLEVRGEYAYARAHAEFLERARLDGSGVAERIANLGVVGGEFTFAGDRLIYTSVDVFDRLLISADLDGSNTATIAVHRDDTPAGALEADERDVFWLASPNNNLAFTAVRATAIGGGTRDLFTTDGQPRHLAIDGDHLYWSSEGISDRIHTFPKAGGVQRILAQVGSDLAAVELIAGAEHVYWSEWGLAGARIQRVPK